MDFWQKARSFAEEAAKRTQEFTKEAANRSQDLTIGSSKLSDVVLEASKRSKEFAAEASKRSKEIAVEASKRSKEIAAEASKRAEQIKFQIPSAALSHIVDSSPSPTIQTASPAPTPADLLKFGVTDDLREFVKGITINTFQDFPLEDDSVISDIPTVSNVRQDLTEFQENHAKFVLSSVKEISKLRYELCPRMMKERKFWRIYFILVNSHVTPYEKKYTEEAEAEIKSVEKAQVESEKEVSLAGTISKPVAEATAQKNKKATSSTSDQDLDVFLLGEDSDDGPDDGDDAFDDDFDKI
uniref:Putative ovule protein n=1 Tax=Solanum chacoense TaxID=4108 RepID=A0A0V0HYV0_SOLCH